MLLAVPLGLAVGLIVGAVGGGGAILALPVLVYVLDEPVGPASTASLVVVALAAAMGAGSLARDRQVCWRIAIAFAAPAAGGSVVGAVANEEVGPKALILAFVPVMLVAAVVTWLRAEQRAGEREGGCPAVDTPRVAVAGLGVGLLTGFFGVGGGFVIVPVLALWLGVGFRRSVATSLVIITLTSAAALASHLLAGARPNLGVTALLAGATMAGALAGTRVGRRLPQHVLGRGFAAMVAAVAAFLLVDTLVYGGPPGS